MLKKLGYRRNLNTWRIALFAKKHSRRNWYSEGMQFDRGYASPYFVTNAEKMLVELEEPYVLIHEKKLSSLQPLLPLLEAVMQAGRPLLIMNARPYVPRTFVILI